MKFKLFESKFFGDYRTFSLSLSLHKLTHQGSLTKGKGSVQLTSLYQLVQISCFYFKNIIYFFTKQATLMRRSIVLSLPLNQYSLDALIKVILIFGCTYARNPLLYYPRLPFIHCQAEQHISSPPNSSHRILHFSSSS